MTTSLKSTTWTTLSESACINCGPCERCGSDYPKLRIEKQWQEGHFGPTQNWSTFICPDCTTPITIESATAHVASHIAETGGYPVHMPCKSRPERLLWPCEPRMFVNDTIEFRDSPDANATCVLGGRLLVETYYNQHLAQPGRVLIAPKELYEF